VVIECALDCRGGEVMTSIGRACLVGSVVAPLVGVAMVMALRTRRSSGARVNAALHWIGVALAGLLVLVVAVHGSIDVGIDSGGSVVVGLSANRLTVTLLVLVLGIGAVVQSFSIRYLRTDPRSSRFVIGAGVLVSSMTVVAASTTMTGLLAGWVFASIGFLAIVGYRPDLPGVRPSTRRTAVAFVIGDGALAVATVIVSLRVGNIALVGPGSLSHVADRLGGAGTLVALLVVIAALARCAQGPFGPWLPGTVAAPTPVSALLHAGFVNGGGILLVRTGALASNSAAAMVVAFTVAAATAVVATAVMAQRSDVKSELAYSTMGQMGFMVAECAVGATGAGIVHLLGHALYKATLFLGSGAQMPRPGRVAPDVGHAATAVRIVLATAAALASMGAVLLVPGISGHRASGPLVLFVAVTAGVGAWSLWTRRHPGRSLLMASLIVAASAPYALFAGGLFAWVGPSLPPVGSAVLSPWFLIAVAGGGAAAALMLHLPVVGLRLRIALIDFGAPAPMATQRIEAPHSVAILQPSPVAGVVHVRSAA
jgi:NAD(P)H-quinone oxidoreductase subunit 5